MAPRWKCVYENCKDIFGRLSRSLRDPIAEISVHRFTFSSKVRESRFRVGAKRRRATRYCVVNPCLFLADKDFSRYAPAKDIVGAFGGLGFWRQVGEVRLNFHYRYSE